MPIYELGYRHYEGKPRSSIWRWWPITRLGVAQALQSKMLQRTLFVCWTPVLLFGFVFFLVGSYTDVNRSENSFGMQILGMIQFDGFRIGDRQVLDRILQKPAVAKAAIWSYLFKQFVGITQGFAALLVIAIVGPRLISQDVRNKSFLLYFSGPISFATYIFGKLGVMLAFLAFVVLLPTLGLYVVSIAFSHDLSTLVSTWIVLVRIIAAWLVLAVPAGLFMLYLSSMTREPRFATAAWLAIVIVGFLFHLSIVAAGGSGPRSYWFLISLRDTVSIAIGGIFDVKGQMTDAGVAEYARFAPSHEHAFEATLALVALSFLSLIGVYRRVTATVRI